MKLLTGLRKFCKLPLSEKAFFLRVFILSAVFRLAILLIPFKKIAVKLNKGMRAKPHTKLPITLKRLGQIIDSVCRHTPWESKCLVQALVCKQLCRRYAVRTSLFIGVDKNQESVFRAHAWVTDDENNVIVGGKQTALFKVVAKYTDYLTSDKI